MPRPTSSEGEKHAQVSLSRGGETQFPHVRGRGPGSAAKKDRSISEYLRLVGDPDKSGNELGARTTQAIQPSRAATPEISRHGGRIYQVLLGYRFQYFLRDGGIDTLDSAVSPIISATANPLPIPRSYGLPLAARRRGTEDEERWVHDVFFGRIRRQRTTPLARSM